MVLVLNLVVGINLREVKAANSKNIYLDPSIVEHYVIYKGYRYEGKELVGSERNNYYDVRDSKTYSRSIKQSGLFSKKYLFSNRIIKNASVDFGIRSEITTDSHVDSDECIYTVRVEIGDREIRRDIYKRDCSGDNYSGNIYVDISGEFFEWYNNNRNDFEIKVSTFSSFTYSALDVGVKPSKVKVYCSDPSQITSISVNNESSATINWESGFSRYKLYRDGVKVYEGSATSFTDNGVTQGKLTTYKLVSVYGSQEAYSTKQFTPPPEPPYLNVNVSRINWSNNDLERGKGRVVLNWDRVSGATGYKIHVFDGYQYRTFDVGNADSWDSSVWRIWPDMNELNNKGDNTLKDNQFNLIRGGGELPDDPNLLYRKMSGTSYNKYHKYRFKISTYNSYGESSPSEAYDAELPNATDTLKPIINKVMINGGAMKTGNPKVDIKIDAVDEGGSGIEKYLVSNDNEVWRETENNEVEGYQLPAGSGQKDIYVKVKDNAGNESDIYKASIYLKDDNDAPKVELSINNGAEYTTSRDVVLVINAYDDLTPIEQLRMRFSSNGIDWTPWEQLAFIKKWNLDEDEGIQRVFMQVVDGVGNIATTGDSIYYGSESKFIEEDRKTEADKENPVIYSFKVANGASLIVGDKIELSIVANDNSGTEGLSMCFAGEDGVWTEPVKYRPKYTLYKRINQGCTTLYVKVIDEAGNSAIADLRVFKK